MRGVAKIAKISLFMSVLIYSLCVISDLMMIR